MCYTIISRDEFIKLYRFGNININRNYILNDDKLIEDNLIKLFKKLPIEYEESYLILKIDVKIIDDFSTIQTLCNLKIEELKSLYVLSEKAQQFYKTKVNQKVNVQITPFKNILPKIFHFIEEQDKIKGLELIRKQYNFIDKEKIRQELGDNIEPTKDYLSQEFRSFFIDLLSYKRENFFPKKDISYIYDLIIMATLKDRKDSFINKFKQGSLALDKSETYQKLKEYETKDLFEIIDFIDKTDNQDIDKFKMKITLDHLIMGALFLKFKSLLSKDNEDANTQKTISNVVDKFLPQYEDSLSKALYLIGIYLGDKNLYEYYYDSLELDIFKEELDNTYVCDKENKEKLETKKKIEKLQQENQELKLKLEKIQKESNEVISEKNSQVEDVPKVKREESKNIEDIKIETDKKIILKNMLESFEQKSLSDIYYRSKANNEKSKKKETLGKINEYSKEKLIEMILNSSLNY